jgi:hypothetical protein
VIGRSGADLDRVATGMAEWPIGPGRRRGGPGGPPRWVLPKMAAGYQVPLCGQEPVPTAVHVRATPVASLVMMKLLFDADFAVIV